MAESVENLKEQIVNEVNEAEAESSSEEDGEAWDSRYEPTVPGGEFTALHAAVEKNDLEGVMTLLQKGAYVNIHDDYGCTALDLALQLGHYQVIRPLVEYGSETFIIMDHLQRSPKRDECLNELLNSGISINLKACYGRTLLQNIFRDEPRNIEFIEKLLDLGADINCFDYRKDGLIHSMANSLMGREVGLPLLMVILKRGIQVETLNLREQTPLQLAIINRKDFMIQPLLEYGAIIGDPTYWYPTLLDEAYDRRMYGCLKEMIRHLIVKELRGGFVEEKLRVKMASPLYVKFYRSCFEEIQGLKLEKISNTPLTFYDLIFKSRKVYMFLKEKKIVEELSNSLIASSYHCTIILGWEYAKMRRHLEDSVLQLVPEVFLHLPYPWVRTMLEKVYGESLENWLNYYSAS